MLAMGRNRLGNPLTACAWDTGTRCKNSTSNVNPRHGCMAKAISERKCCFKLRALGRIHVPIEEAQLCDGTFEMKDTTVVAAHAQAIKAAVSYVLP
mmetsp:Transcript_7264/g.18112  ORF Transcript_7264/g.18112 Transcript_7264/m.18112 type:complete len:96 (+) Transcript_7264:351-638(+)